MLGGLASTILFGLTLLAYKAHISKLSLTTEQVQRERRLTRYLGL